MVDEMSNDQYISPLTKEQIYAFQVHIKKAE